MGKNEPNKNQHVIPQFYQYYWESESKGRLWALCKTEDYEKVRLRAIRNNCSYDYVYEGDERNPSNCYDKYYQRYENSISTVYKRFINGMTMTYRIPKEDKRMVCQLFAHLSARNPKNIYGNLINLLLASKYTLGFEDRKVDQRHLLNMIALADSGANGETITEFANDLMTYKMQVLITTENNIVFCDSIMQQLYQKNELFFPLCPSMVAWFTRDLRIEDGLIRKISREEYERFINRYIKSNLVYEIYSKDRKILDEICKKYIFGKVKMPRSILCE